MMPTSGVRLDSWKEIARYLGRYERTVQLWEKERCLPVHRLPGGKRGGVYAYTAELDAWLALTPGTEGEEAANHEPSLPAEDATDEVGRNVNAPGSTATLDSLIAANSSSSPQTAHWLPKSLLLRWWWALLLIICVPLTYYAGRREALTKVAAVKAPVQVKQLTYRHGIVRSARFRPDGRNLVYSALWEGASVDLYESSLEEPISSSLHASSTLLLAVSPSSTLAVLLNPKPLGPSMQTGTLAVRGLYENKAKPLLSNVGWADWSPDGTELIYTVFAKNGICRIEAYSFEHETHRIYPVSGGVSNQWYSHVRFSPDGKLIAFLQHEGTGSAGHVVVFNLATGASRKSPSYPEISGLAWSPVGEEVWYTAAEKGRIRGLYALDRSGATRLVYQAPAALTLQDISKSGDVLVMREFDSSAVFVKNLKTQAGEIELSRFDWSTLGDISENGKEIALIESGEAVSSPDSPDIYLRNIAGGDATLLGKARGPVSISPDGGSVLAVTNESCGRAILLSSNRQSEVLTKANLCIEYAYWMPDGKRIIIGASEPNHKRRCYIQAQDRTPPLPFSAEGSRCPLVSPDGSNALAENSGSYYKVAIDGKHPPIKVKLDLTYDPIRWLAGDQILTDDGKMQGITTVDLASGRAGAVQTIKLPSGVESLSFIKVSADRQTVAYSGYKLTSDIYLIHGLR